MKHTMEKKRRMSKRKMALLCAASPELLEACKQALSDSECGNIDFERTRRMLVEAIAKAKEEG